MSTIDKLRDEAQRLALINRILALADEHYIRLTVRGLDRAGTPAGTASSNRQTKAFICDWMDLSTEQLQQLHTTITRRKAKKAERAASARRQQTLSLT
jgi:hypothetical protein